VLFNPQRKTYWFRLAEVRRLPLLFNNQNITNIGGLEQNGTKRIKISGPETR
jgi:hypothetical protein